RVGDWSGGAGGPPDPSGSGCPAGVVLRLRQVGHDGHGVPCRWGREGAGCWHPGREPAVPGVPGGARAGGSGPPQAPPDQAPSREGGVQQMVNDVRNYSSTTRRMSLLSAADSAAESIALDSLQGLPDPPFVLILSAGTTSEEIVLATEVSGSSVTVQRAQDGTSAKSHTAGAPVVHGVTGADLQVFMDHAQSVLEVHGVAGVLVGTTDAQTLSGKTMSGEDNTFTDIP